MKQLLIIMLLMPLSAYSQDIYIRIIKAEYVLEIWKKNTNNLYSLENTYRICTFSGGLGPKKKEGDKKSPEGFYSTNKQSLNPFSRYYMSFNIGYPNKYDKAHGYTGSYLMIHGKCVSAGCYAMTDKYIKEIYNIVETAIENGQDSIPIHIFPFRMTDKNMEYVGNSNYLSFWQELKPAYDYFEKYRKLPEIKVTDKKYELVI